MLTSPPVSPRREIHSKTDALTAYLLRCGGSDVLEFENDVASRAAADALRKRSTGISVEARYNKVILKIRT